MSDPLSTVASAAGIISLGIQVIEKIIICCDSWKGYDKDIRDLAHKANGLSKTLQHLENVLQHRQNVDSSFQKQIEDLMEASKVTINKLKEMTDKIPSPSSGSKSAFAKRALYPLRKQTLVDAAGMLDSLQANIDTALSVLLLHQGTVAQNALSQELQTRHSILQDGLAEQNAQLQRMESMLRHLVDNRLQVAPSLLQSMQDDNRHAVATTALRCSAACSLGRRRSAYPQSQVLKKKFRLQSQFLRFSLTLTLSITKGAGGCSIAPTLTYRGITAQDFGSLIDGYFRTSPVKEKNYLQCCHYLFERRIIRPFDRETDGTTLLEAVFSSMILAMPTRRPYESEELFDPLQNVTRYLIEAGVPVITSQDTLLDLLLRHWKAKKWSHPAISELIDAGSYITDKALSPHNRKQIQYFISHHPEAIDLSFPARALVQEDEATFVRIVRQGQLRGNDTVGRCKAIELAIGWPSGVKILLERGMDPIPPSALNLAVDLGCVSSLQMLLEAGIVLTPDIIGYIGRNAKNEQVDLLLDEIILRRTKLRDLAIARLPEQKWRGIGLSHDSLPDLIAPKVYETLRAEGVDVPKRLCPSWYREYAREPTSRVQAEMFRFSVFHSYCLPAQYMQRLYDAGLRDVDEPDSDGWTPLMYTGGAAPPSQVFSMATWLVWKGADVFGMVRWLVSKGADPSRPLPGTGVPALHTIVNTGILSSHWRISEASVNKLANPDQHDLLFLRKAVAENKPDACDCNCSAGGCTPLSISLKNSRRSHWTEYSSKMAQTISELLHLLPPSSTVMETAIRLMTFEDLDLTHTCCDENYLPPFDETERGAIHEEEEQGLSELEQLVDEFMDLYNRLNLPLLQFLQEHWCPRMQDYLQAERPVSEDYLRRIREIGVDLSPSCPLKSDAWCILLQPRVTETSSPGHCCSIVNH